MAHITAAYASTGLQMAFVRRDEGFFRFAPLSPGEGLALDDTYPLLCSGVGGLAVRGDSMHGVKCHSWHFGCVVKGDLFPVYGDIGVEIALSAGWCEEGD